MMPKISRGSRLSGLMVYLLGDGTHNEHENRHVVAGSPTVLRAEWLRTFDGKADKQASRDVALAVAHEIGIPHRLHGTQVRMRAKPVAAGVGARGRDGLDVVVPAGKDEQNEMRAAPVWHCILALEPGEELDDARWARLAEDFMERMGFSASADGTRAQARWAAVRHGKSGEKGEGQEHIHIAASLVREDGSKVSTYDYGPGKARGDWKRAQQVCNELEHDYGLKVLASRESGGGLSGDSRAEIERAKRIGAPESERDRLRRLVRATAVATETEAEFVKALRESGISVAPRYGKGGVSDVTGYKVRFRRDGEEVGPWVGGGKLAGDLTLTALREQQWADSPQARTDALAAWTTESARRGRGADRVVDDPHMWRQALADIGHWREQMAQVPHSDRAQWAWMAGQASGVFAAWSEALEGARPGVFAAAHRELARSAQVPYASQRYRPRQPATSGLGAVTRVLLEETFRDRSPVSKVRSEDALADVAAIIIIALLLLLLIAIAVAAEIARAHRSRGELTRALLIEQLTRGDLGTVRAQWEATLEERRYRWDRDAADVFAAAAGRRSEKILQQILDQSTVRAEQSPTAPAASAAEAQLGEDRLASLGEAAEEIVPGVTGAEAWPSLRSRLADAEAEGRDSLAELAAAVALRDLADVDDVAAVLVWRLDNLDITTAAETAQSTSTPGPVGRGRRALAAAQGPLTAPSEQPRKRRYYTELPEEERDVRRSMSVATTGFGRHDVAPEAWNDARLTFELRHRQAEMRLLADEIEARRADGGPNERQARADNATLAEKAATIPDAQAAAKEAAELEKQKERLERERARLREQLEATPKRQPLTRRKLQDAVEEIATRLGEIAPVAAEAARAAEAAAASTGLPTHDWDQVLRAAQPLQQRARLANAQDKDRRALSDDDAYLYRLQRNLYRIEREHARRESLTPEQRAAEERGHRSGNRRPQRSTGPSLPPRPPTLGPSQDRDHGPEL